MTDRGRTYWFTGHQFSCFDCREPLSEYTDGHSDYIRCEKCNKTWERISWRFDKDANVWTQVKGQ